MPPLRTLLALLVLTAGSSTALGQPPSDQGLNVLKAIMRVDLVRYERMTDGEREIFLPSGPDLQAKLAQAKCPSSFAGAKNILVVVPNAALAAGESGDIALIRQALAKCPKGTLAERNVDTVRPRGKTDAAGDNIIGDLIKPFVPVTAP